MALTTKCQQIADQYYPPEEGDCAENSTLSSTINETMEWCAEVIKANCPAARDENHASNGVRESIATILAGIRK